MASRPRPSAPRWPACASLTLALALAAATAAAEEVDPEAPLALTAAGATWTVGNSLIPGVPGLTVHDAELGAQTHAYDLAARLLVDGIAYVAPTAVREGRSYAGGPALIAGLEVTLRYVVDDVYPVLGALATFENRGVSEVVATVTWENNVGADGAMEVATTSSGDDDLSALDRWVVLDDDLAQGGQPTTWFLLFGRGDPRLVPAAAFTDTTFFSSDEGVRVEYDVRVGAGQVVSLLFLNGLADTMAHGVVLAANADRFFGVEQLVGTGLGAADRMRILNFDRTALAVPALSLAGAAMLVLAVVAFVLVRARRPRTAS